MNIALRNLLYKNKRFKKEFYHEIRLFVTFTFGFTIAFTWRQTFFDISQSFVNFLFNLKNNATSSVLASIFITLLSIFIIYLTSHYLKTASD